MSIASPLPAARSQARQELVGVGPAQTAGRSGALDGLRGLAALAVLCFHAWLYRPGGLPGPRHTLGSQVLFELNLGLICFFVLSGFLLYRPFVAAAHGGNPVDLRRYWLRRLARVVPAYYASVTGALLLYWLIGAPELIPGARQVALFGLFAQSYSVDTLTAINAVTWTLCVEVAFYVLLPIVGLLVSRLSSRRLLVQAAPLLAMVALTLTWNALVHFRHWDPVASKSLPAYAGDFAAGMLAALWAQRRRRAPGDRRLRPGRSAALAGAGILLVIGGGYWHERWGSHTTAHGILTDLPPAAGFALLVAALAAGSGPLLAAFAWRPLLAAGSISYGVYLWHIPLLVALRHAGWMPASLLPRLALILILTVVVATISWIGLERPLIRRAASRGLAAPTRRAGATQAGVG